MTAMPGRHGHATTPVTHSGPGAGRSPIHVGEQAILATMNDDRRQNVLPLPQTPDAIELRHLRAFVAVAEELSFGRAATRLFMTQPALSRRIRTLERLTGCDLLSRSTHHVQLTLAGEALLDRATAILRDVDEAMSVTRSVGGELVGRINNLWAPVASLGDTDADLEDLRLAFEDLLAQFPPPPEVVVRPANAGGVPSLLVTPPAAGATPPTILYLHGGGFTMGSAFGYRGMAGALAAATDAIALVPDYRLAPEHPFPAAVDDAVRAYRWLVDRGIPPHQVTVAGDSAGAALALSLLIRLKQDNQPQPGRAVLLCPGLSLTFGPWQLNAAKPSALRREQFLRMTDFYLNGHPADDPLVNPLKADLAGLAPLLIQAGTGDPFADDAHQLTDHATDHGVEVSLQLYPIDTHDFHLFWAFLPEAADALQQAGTFIRGTAPSRTDAAAGT
jgi:epsilon-lactone hydrolase